MTSLETDTPRGKALDVYDVAELNGDGQRYELIDGVLIVMASPSRPHQRAQARLLRMLFAVEPDGYEVLATPYDILASDTAVQPDVVIVPAGGTTTYVEDVPLLAIEILSPSTALVDLNTKFKRYERAGITHYWIVDPLEPRLIVWELCDGAYVEVADVAGEETWTTDRPVPVTITPSALVSD